MPKKLKGFTLIELIIVIALFSMIMFGAMAMLGPVSKQFSSTAKFESVRANLDNTRLYVEGKLRYADRIHIYSNYNALPANAVTDFSNMYWLNGHTDSSSGLTYDRAAIDSSLSNIRIYVMEIHNDDASYKGKISLRAYEKNGTEVTSAYKNFAVNKAYYEDYGFDINFGEPIDVNSDGVIDSSDYDADGNVQYDKFSLGDFSVTIDSYKKTNSVATPYEKTNFSSTATFALANVYKGGIQSDLFYCMKSDGTNNFDPSDTDPTKRVPPNSDTAPRYKSFDGGSGSKNIFIVFTLPKKIA